MSETLNVTTPHLDNLFTLREFCSFARISQSHFQILRAQGLAPRVTYLSERCPRITHSDANEWLRQRQERAA
jgi:hypothetical protein